MLVANTDSGNACPTSASSASAIVIATIAISNGTSPATTEPNTISSTISAAGSPNPSSPFFRSSPASVSKSSSSVNSPVIAVSKPSRPSARCTASTTSSMSSSASRPSVHQHRRGVAILGDQPPLARVVEGRDAGRALLLQLRRERSHPPLEARLIDRRRRGATTTTSLTPRPGRPRSAAKRSKRSSSARRDSVSLVISSSPDSASPRNAAVIAIAATSATSQIATVSHGRRLLHTASRSVITGRG